MSLTAAAGLITCPVCHDPLGLFGPAGVLARDAAAAPKWARCPRGHNYDVARSGYLNLSLKPVPENADTTAMVEARLRFLSSHAYDIVVDSTLERVRGALILEAGAGPAFYLSRCLAAQPGRSGVAIDISPSAARVAARAHPRIASLVADIWEPLPLADASVDTVMSLFAPRNLPEFARVLKPGGRLVVAVPNPGHLAALRRRFDLMSIHPGKVDDLVSRVPPKLKLLETSQVGFVFDAPPSHVRDLIGMGPNAFHGRQPEDTFTTTVDIDLSLLCWEKQA
jgi:23S rRNA (guanine745-N1)-methyltransferase